MHEQAREQLKEVYGTLLTTLEDLIGDIGDFHHLKTRVAAIQKCIRQVSSRIPKNLRSSDVILHSLRGLDCAVDSLDICLSSEVINFPVTYYWVGRCISILSDILIQIDCILGRGDDEP